MGRLPTADTKGTHDDFPAGDPCDASKVDMAAGVLLLQAERKGNLVLASGECGSPKGYCALCAVRCAFVGMECLLMCDVSGDRSM